MTGGILSDKQYSAVDTVNNTLFQSFRSHSLGEATTLWRECHVGHCIVSRLHHETGTIYRQIGDSWNRR